jgi:serine/threonine protein kinase
MRRCLTGCTLHAHLQALLGLSYMHSRKLIHRDIKSLTLFLDAADNIKVHGHALLTEYWPLPP